MKKLLLAAGLFLALATPAAAQNTTCSDRPTGDSSNACANTRFVQNTAGAASIQPVNVVSLGAKCDWNGTTGTDDHVVIQNALNTYKNVLIPSQCYIGTSTLTFGNLAFATITGINSEWSAIIQASTNAPTISIVSTIPGLRIQHLGITKPSTVTALAGATGILYTGYNDLPVLDDIEVQKHFVGVSLSSTSYGKFQNSYIHDNLSDCVAIQNATILNDYQWNIDTVLAQSCGGWGFNVVTGTNTVLGIKSSQGTWTNAFTFNNTSGGIRFLGNASVPIQGIRLNSPFLGSDKGPELVLDTFNTSIGSHIITSPYLEFNTGGTCLSITANNNGGISIINPAFSTCFTSGINNAANNVFVIGGFITAANTFSIVNSGSIDVLHSDLLGSTSGPISNSGTYIGHLNIPASANTPFAVIDGGTGLALGVSGGVPCYTSTTTMASSVAQTANAILIGGGPGACPTPLVTGSGVNTWLSSPTTANLRAASNTRIALTANTTFNVATTGTDSNNCAAAPCLTIQRAYDNLANFYDLQGFTATIQLANGTYTSGLTTAKCVPGQNGTAGIQILGSATPANVIISVTSNDAFGLGETAFGSGTQGCTQITIGGMRLQTTTAGNEVNISGGGVGITIGTPGFPIDFGASAQNHIVGNHSAWAIAGTNNTISGGAVVAHAAALSGSNVALHNITETCVGSPAFGFFGYAEGGGSNVFLEGMTFTSCGTVTGSRYFASKFGNVITLGNATYLPGNSSGTTNYYGQYVGSASSIWGIADGGTGDALGVRLMMGGNSGTTTIAASTTAYAGVSTLDTTEANVYIPAAIAGTIKNMTVLTNGSPGAGNSWTATLRKTLAATAVTCQITTGLNICTDSTHSASFNSGDRYTIQIVASAGTPATNILWSFEFDPTP